MNDLINKTFKNLVQPAGVVTTSTGLNNVKQINYNTYLTLSPLFKALITSTTTGGEYNLKVRDNKNGFYFYYIEAGLKIKVPLTAIFNTNSKTAGILGIAFSTATYCPSRNRGLCQLDDPRDCYAYGGELQASKKYNWGQRGMTSLLNGLLSQYYFKVFYNDLKVQKTFKAYCKYYNITTLRFNLKGDFKDIKDIKVLNIIAGMGFNLTGYTARDDLRPYLLDLIKSNGNIILNGSNIMYNNKFEAVNSFKALLTAPYQCRGGCLINGCLNCYKYKNITITVLLHGARAGIKLNTPSNCYYLSNIFNIAGLNVTPQDLSHGADLYRNINKVFKNKNLFEAVPEAYLKLNDKGELVFDGHGAVTNYIRHILRVNNINPAHISDKGVI